jgi:hypothetical protein
MSSKKPKTIQKLFVIRTYPSLSQIGIVLRSISQKNSMPLQLSVLGKLTTNKTITKKELEKTIADIKQQLNAVLGKDFQFGYFYNPEIGSLFIAGHLTPTFLNKVDKKALASLPAGLLGIFRGLEIDLDYINSYLNELKNDSYCLIIRGESNLIASIKPMLSGF